MCFAVSEGGSLFRVHSTMLSPLHKISKCSKVILKTGLWGQSLTLQCDSSIMANYTVPQCNNTSDISLNATMVPCAPQRTNVLDTVITVLGICGLLLLMIAAGCHINLKMIASHLKKSLEKALVNYPRNCLSVHLAASRRLLWCPGVFFRPKHSRGVHDWVHLLGWSHIEHRYFGHRRGFGTQVKFCDSNK